MLSSNTHLLSFIPQANAVLRLFLSISAGADQILTLCAIWAGRKQYSGMDQRRSLSSNLEFPCCSSLFNYYYFYLYTYTHIPLNVRKTDIFHRG